MIHWTWLIPAFWGGFYLYGYIILLAERRNGYRREVADIYEESYRKQPNGYKVTADDFKQELELHKN